MFDNIKERWFGKWERIYTNSELETVRRYHDPTIGEIKGVSQVLIVERNTKTGKERAYSKNPTGSITNWDMDYIRGNFDIYEDNA